MIKFIKRLPVLFFLVFNIYLPSTAQDIDRTMAFADSLYSLSNFNLSIRAYQRILFFSDDKSQYYIYSQIGNCYFNQNLFTDAANYYNTAIPLCKNDSIKCELIFRKATCYIFRKNFNLALAEILSVEDSINEYFNRKRDFYFGICYFGLEQYQFAENFFINYLGNDSIKINKVQKLFRKKRFYNTPNPDLAFIFSLIVPGLGQTYAGDIKNGINSFILSSIFIVAGIAISYKYTFIDAIVGVFPWYYRYYQGGYINARKIAEKNRNFKREKTLKSILDILAE